MNKKITVNLSNSFLVRTLCQKCHSSPKNYHCLANPKLLINPNKRYSPKSSIEYIYFMTEDFHQYMKIQDITVSDLNAATFFKSFDPKLHRTRGNHPNNNVSECLTCACGRTAWWFSDRMNKFKPEFSNKKCKYNYPKLFKH